MASKYFPLLICVLFLTSCAKQSAPTGGPKDTIPPRLIKSIPTREAVNFKERNLDLEFSEVIILNNPKDQLIITPSIGKEYDIKSRKNSVIINIPKELDANTTYTFNFRDAVQDITEKNPARNLKIAFSTGPYIDSLSVSGKVYDLLTGKDLKEATVALHLPNDTFNIFKHPATLFTKTNDKGIFLIDHLKPGSYYIYAFDDKNKNLFVDTKNEIYGFLTAPLTIKKDTSKLSIGLVKLDARPLKITGSRPYNSFFNIRASKMIDSFTLTFDEKLDLYPTFGEDASNIRIYTSAPLRDSTSIQLSAADSIGNKIDTTLFVKFNQREVTREKFDASIKTSVIYANKGLLKATLSFTKPVREINFDSLFFQYDSATIVHFDKSNLTWNAQTRQLEIQKLLDKKLFEIKESPIQNSSASPNKPAKEAKAIKKTDPKNILFSGKGAFISAEQDSSRHMTQTISPLKIEDLSLIEYDIKIQAKNIIVQLLDKNLKPIKENYNQPKGKFEDLSASEYLLRVIVDKNADHEWSPGNYFNKEEPEPIIYYKDAKGTQVIPLKANWELVLAPLLTTY